jgi:hypothetical protein
MEGLVVGEGMEVMRGIVRDERGEIEILGLNGHEVISGCRQGAICGSRCRVQAGNDGAYGL